MIDEAGAGGPGAPGAGGGGFGGEGPPGGGGKPPGSGRGGPADESLRTEALPEHVRCPFCGGEETEQFAVFGSALSVSQYYCRPCRTVFEYMKWR